MAEYFHKLLVRCPECGAQIEKEDSRCFDDNDDLFMYSSGTIPRVTCNACRCSVCVSPDAFEAGRVTLCEPEDYFSLLRRNLPQCLFERYNAPDRIVYRDRFRTTLDWYSRLVSNLRCIYPDHEELAHFVELIELYKRYGKDYFTALRIPAGVYSIVREYVHYPHLLSQVRLGEGLTEIGPYTFENCKSLTDIALPDSVRRVGEGAFKNSGLEKLRTSAGLKELGSSAFEGTRISSFFMPSGIEVIGERCFAGCSRLERILLPKSIKRIAPDAFADCPKLVIEYEE